MYLLDTDTLSDLLKPAPSAILRGRLAVVAPEDQFTSSITLGELLYGAHSHPGRRDGLVRQIEDTLLPNLTVLPFD